ncbi:MULTISPECIES: outer membrane usher protein [Proteus]|uniref:outer membrane usher protein n=1 Tax=Proteus TaxID=583 RepID=UPI001378A971|nr:MULTISPECIES: outer membrane usher protein [Proteus]NBM67802.1 outer membrane usher protein [Proteus sp. G2663]NBM87959.1 outer membrane usher protein [Proteus sp. G2661]NBN03805.1 outer membrane usher protein [Proteus sp. G2665]
MVNNKIFRLCRFRQLFAISLLATSPFYLYAANGIEFNTDVLDIKDRANLDLSYFARSGYIMPGTYTLAIQINQQELPEQAVTFSAPMDDPQASLPCLTPELVSLINLKPDYLKSLLWINDHSCLDSRSLQGWTIKGDLSKEALILSIPQAYLEYSSSDWDPPSRWDEGISGILFDYNLNFTTTNQQHNERNYAAAGNGTAGINLSAWRLRADWQMQLDNRKNNFSKQFDWNRYYAYRAIPALMGQVMLGENYLKSDIFDSFRFSGITLNTDDNMLPPNLRGYAPEITGVAKTNARVIISQQDRVLYDTQVAPGPFRIQDLNDAVSGKLQVRIKEQDGSTREFSVDTASIPYLTRPGRIRYKIATGKPTDKNHKINGPLFATGEFSWGISNGWSLYGGGVGSNNYRSIAIGVGRDLMLLGAVSFDVTRSDANLPYHDSLRGHSYRLSYSKRFEDYNSQVTFAGYRFSERNYMNMSSFLDAYHSGEHSSSNSSKEMYTATFNKQFDQTSLFLNYNHQTYWNARTNDSYTLSMARYFDIGKVKNINLSFNAYRNKYQGINDDGIYLSLTLPWGDGGNISYNGQVDRQDSIHRVSYFGRNNNDDTYQISTGVTRNNLLASGYFTHRNSLAEMTFNAGYQSNNYSSLGFSVQGGMTVTPYGSSLHRISMPGNTRVLLDTGNVSGVPIRGYGSPIFTNYFGKAIASDVNSYYRNQLSIDMDALAENMEVVQSVKQITLTQGAIGYRRFNVITGEKAIVFIRLDDGSPPPFGALVNNSSGHDVGIVNDDGSAYLSGLQPGGHLQVSWNGETQCEIDLPKQFDNRVLQNILLPCLPLRHTY